MKPVVFSAPAKVFLVGEYAALAGLPAIVATHAPRFEMRINLMHAASSAQAIEEKENPLPARQSPWGRLRSWAQEQTQGKIDLAVGMQWVDRFEGNGGFGASTAQFVMGYYGLSRLSADPVWGLPRLCADWHSAWEFYRRLMALETGESPGSRVILPSGADLVAQWQGGVVHWSARDLECLPVESFLNGSNLLLFSATQQKGRKIATHEHLAELKGNGLLSIQSPWMMTLGEIVQQSLTAIQQGDWPCLGGAFNRYAEKLREVSLEATATFEDCMAFSQIPGVLGVKGTGALQADGLLVLMESSDQQAVLCLAKERGLELVSDNLGDPHRHQRGVTCYEPD